MSDPTADILDEIFTEYPYTKTDLYRAVDHYLILKGYTSDERVTPKIFDEGVNAIFIAFAHGLIKGYWRIELND